MNDVFAASTSTQSTMEFFGGGDFYLTASGNFGGSVYLERQIPGSEEWNIVADSRVRAGKDARVSTYAGLRYRLTAAVRSGTAYSFATLIRKSDETEVHPLSHHE
jgi:hypothetical protein